MLVDERVLAENANDRCLGRVLAGKYAVIDILGMGGFGAVYRAVQEPVGRPVAVKVVHAHNADDPELRARFFREAKLVARLKDRAVVTLHDYGEEPEIGLYMVFELVEGSTLTPILRQGAQRADRVVNILLQLLRALGEAHELGMVHRDLKPGNVMLVHDSGAYLGEGVRLLDFGIAKVKVAADQEQSLETKRGLVMGTPRYLSPEQARASDEVDRRSDLYSLGVIGYALLAGSNPFERTSVIETIMAHCNMAPPPLDPALGVPPALEAALLKALSKEPEDRFESAEAMAEALASSLPEIGLPAGRFTRTGSIVVDQAGIPTPTPYRSQIGSDPAQSKEPGTWTGQFGAEAALAPPRRRWVWGMVAGLLMLGAAGLFVWSGLTSTSPAPIGPAVSAEAAEPVNVPDPEPAPVLEAPAEPDEVQPNEIEPEGVEANEVKNAEPEPVEKHRYRSRRPERRSPAPRERPESPKPEPVPQKKAPERLEVQEF